MTRRSIPRPAMSIRSTATVLVGGTAALMLFAAAPAGADTPVAEPDSFTSAFTAMATPDQVLNGEGVATPGQPGAMGTFTLRINSDLDIVCYDIALEGVTGDYMSPAKTATHLHQAAAGAAGPPRLAFPNPTPIGDGPRTSSGCMQGPFTTGLTPAGATADSGTGFTLDQIEADPAAFAADTHTVDFAAGAVRGQLTQIPVGSVATGGGGSAIAASDSASSSVLPVVGAVALGAMVVAGVTFAARREVRS
ncbi:CHRD domain-containing protein [Rhodococcus sp. IEGM 1330]|uniref:CHRD domain-containing protein n=1 Tax=Rhodococcus sp. IEGM 1330 TaxID=3082225 RepID=UPI002955BF55|nr:CHRD domain-containing protein [Rhodococcus sp. IEGM 1330]MDV8021866.1 CHRD domain-containing protein [Rhodococcus sp. IEGM 1330]